MHTLTHVLSTVYAYLVTLAHSSAQGHMLSAVLLSLITITALTLTWVLVVEVPSTLVRRSRDARTREARLLAARQALAIREAAHQRKVALSRLHDQQRFDTLGLPRTVRNHVATRPTIDINL